MRSTSWRRLQFLFGLRWKAVRTWWACTTHQCDYYQIYQAFGPADLTHTGFHAGERLALKHFFEHYEEEDSVGCDDCKNWARRLRADVWKQLLEKHENDTEQKRREPYGFQPGPRKNS
jgi:hypothetical protein